MPEESTSTQDGNPTGESTSSAGDEFTPITSQEELNKAVGERIKRVEAKFSDYKDLKAKAAKFDEIEQANKTELEKLNERVTAAESAHQAAVVEALRFKVASKHGISEDDAVLFLTGTDEETLTKQAQRLSNMDAERKKRGAHVAREGGNPPSGRPDDERAAVRQLFGTG